MNISVHNGIVQPTPELLEFHRELFSVASLYDAEHAAARLLYDFSDLGRVVLSIEHLEPLLKSENKPLVWQTLVNIMQTEERVGKLNSAVLRNLAGVLCADYHDLSQLHKDWNGALLSGQHIDRLDSSHMATLIDIRYRLRDALKWGLIMSNRTIHPLTEQDLKDLNFEDEFKITSFSNLDELLDDLFVTIVPYQGYPSKIYSDYDGAISSNGSSTNQTDLHVVRYDSLEGEPLFYAVLSVYWERLTWYWVKPKHEVSHLRDRVGGRIGAARQNRKTLELLAAGV